MRQPAFCEAALGSCHKHAQVFFNASRLPVKLSLWVPEETMHYLLSVRRCRRTHFIRATGQIPLSPQVRNTGTSLVEH